MPEIGEAKNSRRREDGQETRRDETRVKEEKQKCLDIESTYILIDLVIGFQYPAQVDSFVQFLKIQSDYKVMNMDQWKSFLRFPDLRNYDTCEAWPLLLDNFVDWLKKKAV
ncbi:defective in cullin neddylation protein [Striga asiatica]|uniref:Defective in cullin neddylation protein n=1 Tax=Striga asiatica TaxID=4170 RepID=A0A5A7NZ83_STRAF|nr:defective in cullin neddylation protein [Striga asiatica]